MDLARLIRERRTIQSFSNEAVSDAVVKEALELSLWAPNHRLTFPWGYFDVRGDARLKLAELAVELKAKKHPVSEVVRASMLSNFLAPSHLILLGLKHEEKPSVAKENYATLACSVEIASLVLWEKGIGSKWTTSGFTMHPKTYEILKISPTEIVLEGALMIGKPASAPPSQHRPSLSEVLRDLS